MLLSNIAKKIVYIPSMVKTEFREFGNSYILWVSGPFGLWKFRILKNVIITINKASLTIKPSFIHKNFNFYSVANGIIKKNTSKFSSGINISLNQIFVGASVGFKKYLRLRGVGYKFSITTDTNKKTLITDVGFTHLLYKKIYKEMFFKFSRKFTVARFRSKSLVGLTNFTSALRNLKKPDVYKGKGIRYLNENIIYKEGKKKKS